MGKVIAFLNYKGGVGKTTSTMNLSTALWLLGFKVLMIDTDPQASLTTVSGFRKEKGMDTLSDVLWDGDIPTNKDGDIEYPIYSVHDGMSILPGDGKLKNMDAVIGDGKTRTQLAMHTEILKHFYDYILIDCGPAESKLNECVLEAADDVIIPTKPVAMDVSGLDKVLDHIRDKKKNLLGVLISVFDKGSVLDRSNIKIINDNFGTVFPAMMMRRKEIEASHGNMMSIFEYNIKNDLCHEYLRLAEHISGKKRKNNWMEYCTGKIKQDQLKRERENERTR